MKLFCDLETFSATPIRAGSFRYAEDSEARILLWGYAIDDAPARVWDAVNEPIPEDLLNAIRTVQTDPESRHIWHNGINFDTVFVERVRPDLAMPLSRVIDTMQVAYEHGLPGALGDLCTVFGLPSDKAKDRDGARLIRLFCVPRPEGHTFGKADHPADWERFVNYCRLDVEAEREIYKKLPKFNCTPVEKRLSLLDAKINRHGMLMDVELAKRAVEALDASAKRLRERTQELTDGAVASATQSRSLIDFIRGKWGVELKNLQKSEVARLIEQPEIPEPMKELLRTRLSSAKASVKKYQALLDSVCKDGRLRGCLQFRGASRTGRWCLTGDHEVLTPTGWVRLDQWTGGRIAVWSPLSEALSFQDAKALSFPYDGNMYHYSSARCEQISTPDHKMPYLGRDGRWTSATVAELAHKHISIPYTGLRKAPSTNEHDFLRVVIMTQADAHYTEDGQLRFRFKKDRKIQRCKMLLRRVGVPFVVSKDCDGATTVAIRSRDIPLWLRIFRDKRYGYWLFNENADVIFDELPEWDGYRCGLNSIQYSTCVRENADLIQALAALSGRYATLIERKTQNARWATQYVVNIWSAPGKAHGLPLPSVEHFSGTVYCAETTTGFFLVRRSGKFWITGNSGRLFQPQNMSRPSMSQEDIEEAIEATKAGALDMLYENVEEPLTNCLRGAIIVPKGKRMVVADYSNIEGRVLAWMAGESWKLKAFEAYDAGTGPDLYKLTYSRAFNVPVESVTKAQRQVGKVLELAMGYGGGVGAFTTFATAYGIHLESLADAVLPVVPSRVRNEAEKAFEWAEKNPGRTLGLSRSVWVACDAVKRLWRESNPNIVRYWSRIGDACRLAIERGEVVHVGQVTAGRWKSWLILRLPSGRCLCYPSARMEEDSDAFTFMGMDQVSRSWSRISTYGPKCVENLIQSTACDVLAHALFTIDKADGFEPILTVHDEVLCEAPDDDAHDHKVLEKLMEEKPAWAKDLPLAAAGFEAYRYRK